MTPAHPSFHVPVLLAPVLTAAAGARRAVDATLGDGGHAAALMEQGIELLGIDQDPDALAISRARLGERGIHYLQAPFASRESLAAVQAFGPDFILLDLGVSSRQLDQEARGFTFRPGAPLDMRMGSTGRTAADILNAASSEELETLFRDFGDERRARRLAAEIVRRRARQPFATSDDLVNAIRAVLGAKAGPAEFARIFQAVRIAVNDETGQLEDALTGFRDSLKPGGRLSIITYHSGEDRRVKQAFRQWAQSCVCPPGLPVCICRGRALGSLVPRKPVLPGPEELVDNPRARSAKLRTFRLDDAA
jgi:16S rRNA (cytosine1402-N4)-methyltransferase